MNLVRKLNGDKIISRPTNNALTDMNLPKETTTYHIYDYT